MKKLERRRFLKRSATGAGTLLLAGTGGNIFGNQQGALRGTLNLRPAGTQGLPPVAQTRKQRVAVPSACWQCVTRDAIIGYVEQGRLVKIEGHPGLPRTNGKLCPRGQAGINQIYNPDRLLYPLKRVGKRGEGKWQRISWDEALGLIVDGGQIAGRTVKGLRQLLQEGAPEKFMFHYGRMKASSSKIIKDYFLGAYGTSTVGNHTSICESAKWTAQELTWGSHYDNWDLENTNLILTFGCNLLECHTNHIPMAQRCVDALARGAKMYTFDVRHSNTAARSTEWIPIRPGTDLAVVLAMCNVLLENGICDSQFIEKYANVTVAELREHLAQYTPQWAEKISGVPADKIRAIALEYGTTRPSVCISYRGAVMHYNGVQTERAILMMEAIAGNIDVPGGRCRATAAKWKNSFAKQSAKAKLKILDGLDKFAFPTHHVSHQIFKCIDEGSHGRPEIYMFAFYNPVYANGECQANVDLMKDEQKMPFIIACDVALAEGTELADLVLPDATYLERWDWENHVSANNIPEYYIRQPMHPPLGEARNLCDVVCELAKRLDLDLGFSSAEEFVRDACEQTLATSEAFVADACKALGKEKLEPGDAFAYMKKYGVWYDKNAQPAYRQHETPMEEAVRAAGVVLDEATGVYYRKQDGDTDYSSLDSKRAAAQYVAQNCGTPEQPDPRKGFPPDAHRWKTGRFEIKSKALAESEVLRGLLGEGKHFPELPCWLPIPEHQDLGRNQLILTTFKVSVQTHSRTQNCKWLSELYHDNPAWIHPASAAKLGLADGDMINVRSAVGEITTKVRLTQGIVPGVIAISHHCGHWAYGEYASGKQSHCHVCEPDCAYKWWKENGVHPNWVIPNIGDPIGGALRFFDTVVTVRKA